MAEVRARKIDVVRGLQGRPADPLARRFRQADRAVRRPCVSFVSVTQSFNTTSSMGRLTLNILLSFAQFEREVIGERVRDKIAASKRKGIWVGGPVPLGYAAVDKKVVVVPAEAETVRTIFARYLELGSVRALAEDLDRQRHPHQAAPARRMAASWAGARFGVGGARASAQEPVLHRRGGLPRRDVHRGDHAPILDPTLFEAVQAKLAAQAVERRCRLRGSPALLTGRLFDDRGHRMSPTHTNKDGVRYPYYVSQAVLQRKPLAAGAIGRVPAAEIEALISAALRSHLQANGTDAVDGARELIERHVERVTLTRKHIQLQLRQDRRCTGETDADEDAIRPVSEQLHGTVSVTIPWTSTVQAAVKGIIHVPAHNTPMNAVASRRPC